MQYAEKRCELKTGDILLFEGKGFGSWVIKRATFSKWSHVGMVYKAADDVFCYEALKLKKGKDGVQTSLLRARIKDYDGKIWVRQLRTRRTQSFVERFDTYRERMKCREYENNIWELMGAAMPWKNKEDFTSLFCSELIAGAYQALHLIGKTIIANEFTPGDFSYDGVVEYCLKLCDFQARLAPEVLLET